MKREIVLDTETTGLNPDKNGGGDRLVEIGCIELEEGKPTGNHYHQYINPGRPVPKEAQAVHGLTDEFLSDKPKFADIVSEFLDFIADSKLVIHNAPFDMGFLNAELAFCNRDEIPMERAIDTLLIAREKYPGMGNKLDDLCKRLNVDNSNRTLHGALLDSELLAEVYIRMISGEQHGLTLAQNYKASNIENYDTKNRKGTIIQPNPDETKNHEDFISKIKTPVWNA